MIIKTPRPLWRLAFTIAIVLYAGLVTPALAAPPTNSAPALARWQSDGPTTQDTGRVIVTFAANSLHDAGAILSERYASHVVRDITALDTAIITVPAGQEMAAAAELSSLPGIVRAEPDAPVYAAMQPNDPYYASHQWNMALINAPAAWDSPASAGESVIAIIDTGIDLEHPELASKIVPGIDLVNHDDIAQDDHAHGTHVAGIAAAIGNNGQGVAGVAWNARLMPVKILDQDGRGYMSTLAEAIIWAADHGADIINMSVASLSNNLTVRDAIQYAHDRGVVLVAAAGNAYSMGDLTIYPAAFDHVIGVGSVGSEFEHASYSSAGPFVDVVAPGGHSNVGPTVYSTFWRAGEHTYNHAEGTSMAAPHVTGLAALLKAADGSLSPDEIEQVITTTARDLGEPGRDNLFGAGCIDMSAALAVVQPPYLPTTETIYVEAESGRLLTPMRVQPDVQTPSGAFAVSAVAGAGAVELRFTLDQPGLVYLWGLVSSESAGASAFYVSIDNSPQMRWDVLTSAAWDWSPIIDATTGVQKSFALEAGIHVVRFHSAEGSARLDAMAIGGNPTMTSTNLANAYMQVVTQNAG
jgi:subtilisin family serine protease